MRWYTVQEFAKKWDVSPRYVQILCRSGKIPGAERRGRDWMIPEDAKRPVDGRTRNAKNVSSAPVTASHLLLRKSPFLVMTDLYNTPGSADECVKALSGHEIESLLFEADVLYSRGQIDKVYDRANTILENHSDLYAVLSGGMLLSLCAMWKGDLAMWYRARKYLFEAPCKSDADRDIVALSVAASDSAIRNTKDFPIWFTRGCFDALPRDSLPAARVYYIRYLLISAQELAMGNIELDGVRGVGLIKVLPYIIEPMISQVVADKVIMAEIYLRLLIAVAYHQAGDDVWGSNHLDKAIRLCLADGLFGPLVEYRRQLGLFLDDHIAHIDPDALRTVKTLHKQLLVGWTKLHNAVLEKTVQENLSAREREVARLAAFGLSNAEISRQLRLSEHTIISLINSAKNKTGVDHRNDLGLYI